MIPYPCKRRILLSGDITESTTETIINKIIEINLDDDEKEREYVGWKREPIMLFISSYGGEVYDGLALVDMILRSKTPVYTIAIGKAMSMGLWIYLAGEKRYIGKDAVLMWHDVGTFISDKLEGVERTVDELKKIQQRSIEWTIERTNGVEESKLRDYIKRKDDWFIRSDEAIKYGFSHELY